MIRYLIFSYVFIVSCAHSNKVGKDCIEKRGAWDFGSGTIKFKAATVDVCEKRIIAELYYKDESVSFKEDLSRSKSQTFSDGIQKKAEKYIKEVLKETSHLKLKSHKGVATAAFREAKNALIVISKFNSKYKLNIKIITQEKEAQLGVISAGTKKSETLKSAYTVWDIGGGSQQITQKTGNEFKTYKSQWAAVSFKSWVLKHIKKNNTSKSPNPLSIEDFNKATEQAQIFASEFKFTKSDSKNKNPANELIYGIGGVHAVSIKSRLSKSSYTQKDLKLMAKNNVNKDDKAIGGRYASTDVTNIALVLGTMKALGFKKVHPVRVGLVEGVLVSAY